MKKYLILDFGKVLAYPKTGDWFITPLFLELINMDKLKREDILKIMNNHGDILSRKAITLEDEYNLFYDFYKSTFIDLNYSVSEEVLSSLAHDFTYTDNKYGFYKDIYSELDILKEKYILLLLSDNWPCCGPIMDERNLSKYFDKIYISSVYGTKKSNGDFFDILIDEYNIKEGEAYFVDDNESLLDIALEKGLDVRQMDREGEVKSSKHKIIHDLKCFY
ncbi:MAG: HAD hydrolase-like protein [Bacilli bacterium]|nr:HAD hydrolase-like protein [Bacilli bacterium]